MAAAKPLTAADFPPGYFEEYSGNSLEGISIAFIVLGVAFVTLRFMSRRYTKIQGALDDTLILLALVSNISLCGLSLGKSIQPAVRFQPDFRD
jgi:hypothetical protein